MLEVDLVHPVKGGLAAGRSPSFRDRATEDAGEETVPVCGRIQSLSEKDQYAAPGGNVTLQA